MMNMLTNKVPFGLLDDEEQKLFTSVAFDDLMYFVGGLSPWSVISDNIKLWDNSVYRLKLKEGEWYKVGSHILLYKQDRKSFFNTDGSKHCSVVEAERHEKLRHATKEEIESVKPKDEGFVDVEIEWEGCNANIKYRGETIIVSQILIGESIGYNLVLSGYIFHSHGFARRCPVSFDTFGKSIEEKATQARFVKL